MALKPNSSVAVEFQSHCDEGIEMETPSEQWRGDGGQSNSRLRLHKALATPAMEGHWRVKTCQGLRVQEQIQGNLLQH
jgi:hypothetical protein